VLPSKGCVSFSKGCVHSSKGPQAVCCPARAVCFPAVAVWLPARAECSPAMAEWVSTSSSQQPNMFSSHACSQHSWLSSHKVVDTVTDRPVGSSLRDTGRVARLCAFSKGCVHSNKQHEQTCTAAMHCWVSRQNSGLGPPDGSSAKTICP
jgi:hypothetical protein